MVDTSDAIREQTVSALKGSVVEQQFEIVALRSRITALEAERDRLSALVYVPGLWHCPKCKFQLMQANLNAHSGTVTPRDQPGDKCPNCDSPLWRVSERDARNEMVNRCEQAVIEASNLRAERDRMREALKIIQRDEPSTDDLCSLCEGLDEVNARQVDGSYDYVGCPECRHHDDVARAALAKARGENATSSDQST